MFTRKPTLRDVTERDALIEANQRFVWMIALRYMPSPLGLDELVAAGQLGLLRAAELWNPTMGKFTTIAQSHIAKAIRLTIWRDSHVLTIPRAAYEAAKGYSSGRQPDAAKAAQRVIDANCISLTDSIDADGLTVVDREPADIEDREELETLLRKIPVIERQVIRLRYGLDDGRERTFEEVGQHFGKNREWIRQIEARGLKRLRRLVVV